MGSLDELTGIVESSLEEYNNTHKNRMNLVIFRCTHYHHTCTSILLCTVYFNLWSISCHCRYVLEHLSRICRVLKQPGGNALLVGVGGSGRQSLTRLATSMADFVLIQPEISKSYGIPEWKEDLKVGYSYYYSIACLAKTILGTSLNRVPVTFYMFTCMYMDIVKHA